MVDVQSVDLAPLGIMLPSDRVGMVVCQPHVSLTNAEPYRCVDAAKPRALQAIVDTLHVARSNSHGLTKTHFTIFPEYSIPGTEGVDAIETALANQNWPRGTIVIGGCDGLRKQQFLDLSCAVRTYVHGFNPADDLAANQWINCVVTWVKAEDGSVYRWLQPKLAPAGPERDVQFQDMFRGRSAFVFRGPLSSGTQYRFASLVCFDWIATIDGQVAWRRIVERLAHEVHPNESSLSWFVVIEHNKKPSHDTFLEQVRNFFDQNITPSVHRDRTCLVFANSAGLEKPGRTKLFGTTSLVFSAQTLFEQPTCPMTFSTDGRRFRGSRLLDPFKQVLFRESGACVHSFAQVNPSSVSAGPAGGTYAVENAFVFPLGGIHDRRAPSNPVAACVKWVNDELDDLQRPQRLLGHRYSEAALAAEVNTEHEGIVNNLRVLPAQSLTSVVELSAQESLSEHADDWSDTEAKGLEHVVNAVSIVSVAFGAPVVGTDPSHATVSIGHESVHLLAVIGSSHEHCMEHAKRFLPLRGQVLVISRDTDNTPWHRGLGNYLQPEAQAIGSERNITDPTAGLLHIGYADLLQMFRHEGTAAALQGAIIAKFAE
jgi:hypothetical protein